MAIEQTRRQQAIGAIDEYLLAAGICIRTSKPGGGILGYPAALLLLCAADAIGQGALPNNRKDTRLDVLGNPLFGQVLTYAQADQVTKWYRHLLAHSATMAAGVHLEPDAVGEPFEFDTTDAPVLIRVGALHRIVSAAWARVDKETFEPPCPKSNSLPDPAARPLAFDSTLTHAVSGVINLNREQSSLTPASDSEASPPVSAFPDS